MKRFFSAPYRFVLIHWIVLFLVTGAILLETFVIPRGVAVEPPIPQNPQVGATDESVSDRSTQETDGGAANDTASDASTQEPTDGTTEDSAQTEPVITKNSYRDANISITISTIRRFDTDVYVADVVVSSVDYLKTAFANNTYGRNIKQTTSKIAASVGAIFAVNGDYYGFRNSGYVIRNGVLYRDSVYSSSREALVVGADGALFSVYEKKVSAKSLYQDNAEHVLSFGPTLVQDRKIMVTPSDEIGKWTSNPRASMGMIEPLHYVFIVSDGRTSKSAGLSLYQLAQVYLEYDCEFAYNLDGGGSATMVFNGRVINIPTDGSYVGERKVSDIVYIGY